MSERLGPQRKVIIVSSMSLLPLYKQYLFQNGSLLQNKI
jgi:hypothetical protein